MKFRPCIDIHNGRVKQIVGSSLRDAGDEAYENYVAKRSAAEFAALFRDDGLTGGHVILLNGRASEHYRATADEAKSALYTYPGGLQVGGGITAENAKEWIDAGASHVIVTSYAFCDGKIAYDHLDALVDSVGKEHIVLDLSCKKREGVDSSYYICTDRWQKMSEIRVTERLFDELSKSCAEFLVHGVAVEGKGNGMDEELLLLLSAASKVQSCPITYAGGIRSLEDIRRLSEVSGGALDYTVGSALDLYGGKLPYKSLVSLHFSAFST